MNELLEENRLNSSVKSKSISPFLLVVLSNVKVASSGPILAFMSPRTQRKLCRGIALLVKRKQTPPIVELQALVGICQLTCTGLDHQGDGICVPAQLL